MAQELVLIAGMHRSGTSALTRALNLAGIPLPNNLMPPAEDNNDEGFWEPADLVGLHDRLLSSMGSTWADHREIPQDWFVSAGAEAFGAELHLWLQGEFEGKRSLLVKDPRVCRILPLWQRICEQLDIDLRVVISVRNPIEVTRSLEKRDGFKPLHCALIWLRDFLDAERFTRSHARCFVDFDGLLNSPLANIRRVADQLELSFPLSDAELSPLLNAALKPSLRHHVALIDQLTRSGGIAAQLLAVYNWVLDEIAGKNPDFAVLDGLTEQLRALEGDKRIVYAPSI